MRGSGVEVVIALLYVLAVIPLGAAKTEEALLEDGVFTVPEGEREADALMVIADARDAVFAPAVGSEVRILEGKVFPGCAVRAVVFPDGSPFAFG
jgi:hypothetical protein